MKVLQDMFEFSTGRQFYANNNIVGLAPGSDRPSEGYDGGVDSEEWTAEERRELAEFMAGLWKAWGEAAVAPRPKGGCPDEESR